VSFAAFLAWNTVQIDSTEAARAQRRANHSNTGKVIASQIGTFRLGNRL